MRVLFLSHRLNPYKLRMDFPHYRQKKRLRDEYLCPVCPDRGYMVAGGMVMHLRWKHDFGLEEANDMLKDAVKR